MFTAVAPAVAQRSASVDDDAGWYAAAFAGGVRVDADLSRSIEVGWAPTGGVQAGYRPGRQVTLSALLWVADPGTTVRGVGLSFAIEPWIDRPLPVQPVLHFGVEAIGVDDGGDRGPALAFAGGVRRRIADTVLEIGVWNRFLNSERRFPDGVIEDRDTVMWEIRMGVGYLFGRDR